MLTRHKPLHALDRSQQPLVFVSVNRVLNVLPMCHKLQVLKSVVSAVKVLVVNFKSSWNGSVKRFPHKPVNGAPRVLCVFAQRYLQISLQQSCFARPMPSVSRPCLAQFDRVRGRDADAQKFGHFFERSALNKHLFGLRHFSRVYGFGSGDSAHIACIAHFIQIFKTKNWFPRFHAQPLFNMNSSVA